MNLLILICLAGVAAFVNARSYGDSPRISFFDRPLCNPTPPYFKNYFASPLFSSQAGLYRYFTDGLVFTVAYNPTYNKFQMMMGSGERGLFWNNLCRIKIPPPPPSPPAPQAPPGPPAPPAPPTAPLATPNSTPPTPKPVSFETLKFLNRLINDFLNGRGYLPVGVRPALCSSFQGTELNIPNYLAVYMMLESETRILEVENTSPSNGEADVSREENSPGDSNARFESTEYTYAASEFIEHVLSEEHLGCFEANSGNANENMEFIPCGLGKIEDEDTLQTITESSDILLDNSYDVLLCPLNIDNLNPDGVRDVGEFFELFHDETHP